MLAFGAVIRRLLGVRLGLVRTVLRPSAEDELVALLPLLRRLPRRIDRIAGGYSLLIVSVVLVLRVRIVIFRRDPT